MVDQRRPATRYPIGDRLSHVRASLSNPTGYDTLKAMTKSDKPKKESPYDVQYWLAAVACGVIALGFFPPFVGAAGLIFAAIGKSRGEPQAVIGFTVAGIGMVFGTIYGFYAGYMGWLG